MTPNHSQTNPYKALWPGKRAAFRRLALITAILFPISWVINLLINWFVVGRWPVTIGEQESKRHFVEWMVILAIGIGAVFWVSLVPRFRTIFKPLVSRRCLIGLAWIVTLVALFYAEENWRGQRSWNNYRKQLEARGEQLDFRAFIPKPVPDQENFAATPFIQSWFQRATNSENGGVTFSFEWEDNFSKASQMVGEYKTNKSDRHFVDIISWKQALDAVSARESKSNSEFRSADRDRKTREEAAPGVLAKLQSSMTNFAELRAASTRPHSRYPVEYNLQNPWAILLPHLARVKQVCLRLNLEACAALAAGQTGLALDDIKLMLYMADSVKEEPILISYLVRLACVQLATQPVWEGLADRRWTEAQLKELQEKFERYEFLRDLKWPMDSERAAGILTGELLRKDKKLLDLFFDQDKIRLMRVAPNGWFYFEQKNYARLFQEQMDGLLDANQKRVFSSRVTANSQRLERELTVRHPLLQHRIISTFLLPSLGKLPFKAAEGQTAADETALACALERYRLANGQFPDALGALVPKFISKLPRDVFSGDPYKYRRTEDGQFILYSVGRNEKDDGGIPGKTLFGDVNGDLVWRYPTN